MSKNTILKAGDQAPDFTLPTTPDQKISLSELKGKAIVLVFYPADFSPVCTDETAVFNKILPELKKYDAQVVGISVDNTWCHNAFTKEKELHFPLLSDFQPKGEVAKKYGVYDEKTGICERALFLIDKDGVIAWSYLAPTGENPGTEGVLEALEHLQGTAV